VFFSLPLCGTLFSDAFLTSLGKSMRSLSCFDNISTIIAWYD
jgi:hypothetical protein